MSLLLAALVAAGIFLLIGKSRWNYDSLPELPVTPEAPLDDVAILIPARNEEANIGRAVSSLQPGGVFVVDDDSSDRTAEVAVAAGAEVLRAPRLKANALGKPNACWAGAQATQSKWILFVDADTWYEPPFLPSLLAYARRESMQVLTVFLRQECLTWPEKVLLPYAFALYFTGVSARNVNSPKSMEALANGQCLLVQREAYEFMGGHKAVISSVIEDVALAARAKRHRLKLQVMRAEHLGHVRMYDGLKSIWHGFEKNSVRFLSVNPWVGVQVIAASILLTSYIPVLIALIAEGQYAAAVLFALAPAIALRPWYGNWTYALQAPIAIYLFQAIALTALLTTATGGKSVWKGRKV